MRVSISFVLIPEPWAVSFMTWSTISIPRNCSRRRHLPTFKRSLQRSLYFFFHDMVDDFDSAELFKKTTSSNLQTLSTAVFVFFSSNLEFSCTYPDAFSH